LIGCTLELPFAHLINRGIKKSVRAKPKTKAIPARMVMYPSILILKCRCIQ
jgi:hypothetical protein